MQNFETMLSAAQPSAHQQQSGADPQHQQQQQQQQQQSTPGGWFDLTIKSEPVDYHSLHHPMLHHNHHHHHHHHSQHLNHQQTAQQDTLLPSDPHSNPTSPQSVDSMDSLHGKGGFFDGKPTGGLMGGGGGGGYNPLGFNPLTPPGYSGLLVSTAGGNQAHQQHQLPSQHLQQQQHQRLLTPNRLLYGGGKPDIASLTPTHTPPMDVTPPKSPKEPLETPIKEDEPGSDCEDASLDDGSEDEDGIRKPKVNSHGQVKKFRCKQCDFVAVTKLNFWEHTRSHIKPEKMLTCPKCPFVTEYKHHLEYHLRNHQRSKPFQCPKCSYSCVNKSMLNSHMKSHSNVFQYRCADCNYATKYCHSLKLHLRKYGHKPDVVLNLDGTPNPLPIIDVYGTRRGPKAKPQKNAEKLLLQQQQQQHDQQQQQQQLEHLQDAGKQQDVKFLASVGSGESTQAPLTPLGQQGSAQGVTPTSPFTPLGGGQTNGLMRNLFPHQLFPSPLAHMFKNAAANGALPLFPYLNLNFQMFADQQAGGGGFQPNLMGQLTGDKLNGSGSSSTSSSSNGCGGVCGGGVSEPDNDLSVRTSSSGGSLGEELLKQITAAAADSSACEPSVSGPTAFEEPQTNPRTPSLGVKGERSRRKGRAFKLERFSERPSSSGPDVAESVEQRYEEEEPPKTSNPTCTGVTRGEPPKDGQRSLECRYCDIVFRDDVLYTIHMGYHGYDDVFKCNMCGEKSEDRIGFFLHIARKAH